MQRVKAKPCCPPKHTLQENKSRRRRRKRGRAMQCVKASSEAPGREKPPESATVSSLVDLIPGLPNEIALGVLVRLPLVFQARLRVVCRSWKHAMEPAAMRSLRKELKISEVCLVLMDPRNGNYVVKLNDGYICKISVSPPRLFHNPMSHRFRYFGIIGHEVLVALEPQVADAPFEDCAVAGLYSLDITRMEWNDAKFSSLPMSLSLCAVDMEGGYAYAASRGSVTSSIMRLDLNTKMWEVLPDPHVRRGLFAGVVLQNQFCILGGIDQFSRSCKSGEIWDPINQEWTLVPQLFDFDGNDWPNPTAAVVMDRLYARRSRASNVELMYYEGSSKVWKSLGRVCDPERGDIPGSRCRGLYASDRDLYVGHELQVWTTRPSVSKPLSWKSLRVGPGNSGWFCGAMLV